MKSLKLGLIISSLVLIIALLPLAGACTAPPTTQPTTQPTQPKILKIGLLTSITGMFAPAFKPIYDAVEPTVDLLNQKGGITVDGQKYLIEIIVEDDTSVPPGALAAANKLIGTGIKFMIPPMAVPCNLAVAPVCEEAKILRVSAICFAPELFGPQAHYSFDTLPAMYNIAPHYDYLVKNYPKVKRIAVIPVDDPGAKTAIDWTVAEIKKKGLELVFSEAYPPGNEDFYPILTKALQQKPDAIDCIVATPPWAAGIINQSRELGFTGPIYAPCGLGDLRLINSMVKPEYAYDIFQGLVDQSSDKMSPMVKELRPLIEKKTGAPFMHDNINVLAPLLVILQGIEKAQSFDVDKVVAELEKIEVETAWGTGKFGGSDLVGNSRLLILDQIPLSRINKGNVEFEYIK